MRTEHGLVQAPTAAIWTTDLLVVCPLDALGYIAKAEQGDRCASLLMAAVNEALHVIDDALPRSPLMCAACPQQLLPGVRCAIVVTLPEREGIGRGAALAVCRQCATSRADVHRKAVMALRIEALGLRVIDSAHAAGGRT
ncbi:MAG: hypothetical protein ACRYG6_04825 [Janthinobacterium lividum]